MDSMNPKAFISKKQVAQTKDDFWIFSSHERALSNTHHLLFLPGEVVGVGSLVNSQ
jgi:hypothetical protein